MFYFFIFSWLICEYCIIAGSHMRAELPGVHPVTASILLFLTEFNEHIWSEDKRGRWDGAKRQRGEWGANGEGWEQAEDEDLRPFIITVPHEGRQLLQTAANNTFTDLSPTGPQWKRLLEAPGNWVGRTGLPHLNDLSCPLKHQEKTGGKCHVEIRKI